MSHEVEDLKALGLELHAARVRHLEARQRSVELSRKYEEGKADAYLMFLEMGEGHFKALSMIHKSPNVRSLRRAAESAELDQARAWTECQRLIGLCYWERGLKMAAEPT